ARLRLEEEEPAPLARRARLADPAEGPAGERLGELPRVRGGRRGGDQLRLGAERPAEPEQAREDVMEVAAEDAPVGVELVEHDPTEIREERTPGGPVAEEAEVQHVRIGDHDARKAAPDRRALGRRGVAVVDLAPGLFRPEPAGGRDVAELPALVLP